LQCSVLYIYRACVFTCVFSANEALESQVKQLEATVASLSEENSSLVKENATLVEEKANRIAEVRQSVSYFYSRTTGTNRQ